MDQHRHLGFLGEFEDVVERAVVEHEVLRARVQLDPPGAVAEAPFALRERVFERVEAAERHEPSLALPGPCQHAVVGQAVAGTALGVVQGEHACPSRLGRIELAEQLLERQRAAVLVESEVRVGVDHFGVGGPQAGGLGEEWGERIGVDRVVHGRHVR